MYVRKAVRGRGLAREMLHYLERTAAEHGRTRLVLETGDRQPEAVALYRSEGYTPIAGFGYYQDHPASISMAKTLPVA
ncbi:MAG: GNAT family N-acetyltransferase [Streptosporangiaceae bacterium]